MSDSDDSESTGSANAGTTSNIAMSATAGSEDEMSRYGILARYGALMARKSNMIMAKLRPMAYASEFGESFRPFVNKKMVNTMYGLSFAYVFADVGFTCYHIRDRPTEVIGYTALDQSLWHGMASLAMPAITIHQIVHASQKYAVPKLSQMMPKYGRFAPIAFGLGSIPFIIHPLDHLADFIMDNTARKYWYGDMIEVPAHDDH